MTEVWNRGRSATPSIAGEMIFDSRLPDLPWYDRAEYLGPRESGCAFLPINLLYGDTTRAVEKIDNSGSCPETIGHRSETDSVWIAINPRIIDAGTFFHGVVVSDASVRGRWSTGSQSLEQGGAGTFVMRRLRAPPREFDSVVRRVRLDRLNENFLSGVAEAGWQLGRFWPAAILPYVLAFLIAVRPTRSTTGRRKVAGALVLIAIALQLVMLWILERDLHRNLFATMDFPTLAHGARILGYLLIIIFLIPALAIAGVRKARRGQTS